MLDLIPGGFAVSSEHTHPFFVATVDQHDRTAAVTSASVLQHTRRFNSFTCWCFLLGVSPIDVLATLLLCRRRRVGVIDHERTLPYKVDIHILSLFGTQVGEVKDNYAAAAFVVCCVVLHPAR